MYMGDIVYKHGMEIYNDRQKMLGSFSYDDKLQSEEQL